MHLFAGKLTQDMTYQSYDTLGNSLSTVFMAIIGDGKRNVRRVLLLELGSGVVPSWFRPGPRLASPRLAFIAA